MRGGVFEVDRLLANTDIADQAFIAAQTDHADRILVQAFGGHQFIAIGIGIEQIDGTDVGFHRLAHTAHNDLQRGRQILR